MKLLRLEANKKNKNNLVKCLQEHPHLDVSLGKRENMRLREVMRKWPQGITQPRMEDSMKETIVLCDAEKSWKPAKNENVPPQEILLWNAENKNFEVEYKCFPNLMSIWLIVY